jgi:hypothetical protein
MRVRTCNWNSSGLDDATSARPLTVLRPHLRLVSTYVCFSYPCFRNFTEGVASVLRTDMNLFTDKRCPIWGLISDSDSQSYPPLEPQEDLQTWGHQLHHSVRFGDSSRTQKQSGPAPLDDSQDLQTVGNQPPHSVRLRDLFSDSDATLSRYSGAPGRPLAATTPFLGHRYFRT